MVFIAKKHSFLLMCWLKDSANDMKDAIVANGNSLQTRDGNYSYNTVHLLFSKFNCIFKQPKEGFLFSQKH